MHTITGTIKNVCKGFCFIKGDDGEEYFGHKSALQNSRLEDLREGQAVRFEPSMGPKGPRAEGISVGATA